MRLRSSSISRNLPEPSMVNSYRSTSRSFSDTSAKFFDLIRFHVADWIVFVLLLVGTCVLQLATPFKRYAGKEQLVGLKFPLKSNTVPPEAVPVIALVAPLLLILILYFFRKCKRDFHHSVLGLLYTLLLTAFVTELFKIGIGRLRPDFFYRCFPDGKAVFGSDGDVICNGEEKVINEGRKSFPSGHSSMSFSGLTYISLFIAGKLQIFDGRGHHSHIFLVFIPFLAACGVGVSRIDDYWHHWSDVVTGALIGIFFATVCYHMHYPSLTNEYCHVPFDVRESLLKLQIPISQNDPIFQNDLQNVPSSTANVEMFAHSISENERNRNNNINNTNVPIADV